jgi:hypothetical protein
MVGQLKPYLGFAIVSGRGCGGRSFTGDVLGGYLASALWKKLCLFGGLGRGGTVLLDVTPHDWE